MEIFEEDSIWTPWFYSTPKTPADVYPDLEYNYTLYKLFAIKTWIFPWIHNKYGKSVDIIFSDRQKNDKTYVTIKLVDGDKIIDMSNEEKREIEDLIKKYNTDKLKYVLLEYPINLLTKDNRKIPDTWIKQMFKFVSVDIGYNPYICDLGLAIDLHLVPDYKDLFITLTINISDYLMEMYDTGYIFRASKQVIQKWKLEPEGDKGLYKYVGPKDPRLYYLYGSMTDFLLNLSIYGYGVIYSYLPPDDFGYRHILTNNLGKINFNILTQSIFKQDRLDIIVDNLELAIKICDVIDKSKKEYLYIDGKIGFMMSKQLPTTKDLHEMIYKTDDEERPYTISKLITNI